MQSLLIAHRYERCNSLHESFKTSDIYLASLLLASIMDRIRVQAAGSLKRAPRTGIGVPGKSNSNVTLVYSYHSNHGRHSFQDLCQRAADINMLK